MESPSVNGSPCLSYDVEQARLQLVDGEQRHDVAIRAQAHRLVRYMVERNAGGGGGGAVLCTHEELMHAVWADEPMHTRVELAKLVWELRKKLEPFGGGQLIENARGLGYRLHTCSAGPAARSAPGLPRRRLLAVALALVVLAAAIAGAVLATRGHGSDNATRANDAELRTFVDRVENVLQQAESGRREITAALTAGFKCSISPHEAGQRIASVADNRQSILGQLGIFQAPTQRAEDSVTQLQRALQQSIEADRHYRDAFFETAQRNAGCPPPKNASFTLAARSNARATAAKRRFVAAFNPLAARVHRQAWSAGDF
jgi:DNA-binding winged helix-turn-helix (wHTH) protein